MDEPDPDNPDGVITVTVIVGDTLIGDSVSSNPHTYRGVGGDDTLMGNAGERHARW